MCNSLDGMLHEFLEASGVPPEGIVVRDAVHASKKKRKEVEGVWVACRDEDEDREREKSESHSDSDVDAHDEKDEMIWWSWEGKLVGFSDW